MSEEQRAYLAVQPSGELATAEQADGGALNMPRLMELCVKNGGNVETLERLMTLAERMERANAVRAFRAALTQFQRACPIITKAKAVMNKDGRTERYRYAPLEHIKKTIQPYLDEAGLTVTWETETVERAVKATCTVKHGAGHSESSSFLAPVDPDAFMNLAQKFASALSFAKRYALMNALGLVVGEEDDDAVSTTPDTPQQRHLDKMREAAAKRRVETPVQGAGPEPDDPPPHEPAPVHQMDSAVLDLLTQAGEASDAAELGQLVEQANLLEDTASMKTVKTRINERAKHLKLKWNSQTKTFQDA